MLAVRSIAGTLHELIVFLWRRKLWWLIPVVLVLLIFSALTILSTTAGIGPFIYTLF